MKLKEIISATKQPAIYTKGTSIMWTDEHISKQLLNVHLNPDIDLASRKKATIEKTVNWILEKADKAYMNILDLGCDSGLYTELMAQKGHQVTGVDFSKNSIEYASGQAKQKGLGIQYINQNYLDLDEENKFDLIILIFTDLGVLTPTERDILLVKIHRALKPGGTFVFDLLNDKDLETKMAPKNWEMAEAGFWKDKPYLCLSESFLYPEKKVILYQHTVIDEKSDYEVYRFYTNFFNQNDIEKMLIKHHFGNFSFYENVLPEDGQFNGENVTFCVTTKE